MLPCPAPGLPAATTAVGGAGTLSTGAPATPGGTLTYVLGGRIAGPAVIRLTASPSRPPIPALRGSTGNLKDSTMRTGVVEDGGSRRAGAATVGRCAEIQVREARLIVRPFERGWSVQHRALRHGTRSARLDESLRRRPLLGAHALMAGIADIRLASTPRAAPPGSSLSAARAKGEC